MAVEGGAHQGTPLRVKGDHVKVTLVGMTAAAHHSTFRGVTGDQWEPETLDPDGSSLVEFAGRACYQSWRRPNAGTAANDTYVHHLIEVGHLSVVEHASVSFYIEDVSRSLTHELVRHRHFSFSQLSQRYVQAADKGPVVPPLYMDDEESADIIMAAWQGAIKAYDMLVAAWMPRLIEKYGDATVARKRAREAARCVLPNMTPTAIVVTGNHRTWREFIGKRAKLEADAEICELAVAVFNELVSVEPNLYQDMRVVEADGRLVVSPL